MASKKKYKEIAEKRKVRKEIKRETQQAIFAIIFFVLALLSLLAPFHLADPVGKYVYEFLKTWFGIGYFLLPISFVMTAVAFLKGIKTDFEISKIISVFVFFFAGIALMYPLAQEGGYV